MLVIIHHNELVLKGKNRSFFENLLVKNIKNSFKRKNVLFDNIKKDNATIVCTFPDNSDMVLIKDILLHTFGINNFSFVAEVEKNIDAILTQAKIFLDWFKDNDAKTIDLITKRSDKSFEFKSPEINAKIGFIVNQLGMKIKYRGGEKIIYTEVTPRSIYMYTEKILGLGGMPHGSAGKALCLFSGGIDSPVAAWKMMKRGCQVDFVHFHSLRSNNEVMESKIKTLIEKLNEYQGTSVLYSVPYHIYQVATLGNVEERFEVVIFRNFMIQYAQKIADKDGYHALVMGDCLAQVASQTLENLHAVIVDTNSLIFRPIISYDKQEVIDIAKKIDTYEESIRKYKDCCSIIARKPATRVKIEQIKTELEKLDMSAVIEKTQEEQDRFVIE